MCVKVEDGKRQKQRQVARNGKDTIPRSSITQQPLRAIGIVVMQPRVSNCIDNAISQRVYHHHQPHSVKNIVSYQS